MSNSETKITKDSLIRTVAVKENVSLALAERFVNATLAALTEGIAAGKEVGITGLLSVKRVERNERVRRNPRNSEEIVVPAHTASVMKMSKSLAGVAITYQ